MTIRTWQATRSAVVISFFLLFVGACALLGPSVESHVFETKDGVVLVESVEMTATVKAVDRRARTVSLDLKHRRDATVTVSPDMENFNQIQVGDEVHAVIIEETAVSLIRGGTAESVGEAAAVAFAPRGEKPGLAVVTTREITADIVAIDAHSHQVTLEFIDGTTETVKVGKHFDLTTISLEDSVRVQITDAIAIDIVKKQD